MKKKDLDRNAEHTFYEGAGSLYQIGSDLKPVVQLADLTISNGLAWSEDQKTFYFIDTPTRQIREFDFDLESGEIRFRRVAVRYLLNWLPMACASIRKGCFG